MAGERPREQRWRHWRQARADLRLFRHLGEVHDLATEELELLVALADHHRLVRLAEIFVRPGLFHGTPDPQRWSTRKVAALGNRLTRRDSAPTGSADSAPAGSPDRGEPPPVAGEPEGE